MSKLKIKLKTRLFKKAFGTTQIMRYMSFVFLDWIMNYFKLDRSIF